jgi:lysophospholipase L1-like esterase
MGWTRKEFAIASLMTVILLVVALGALEIILAILRPGPNQRDTLLGWKLRENIHREFPQRTFGGKPYLARLDTNAQGLRIFGDDEAAVRILVLGDSFTADPTASDNRMWFASMAERLAARTGKPLRDFYVLAGGGGGWGTYQNLLLSRKLSRTVKPDLFVLEFCSNDFQNNLLEWEREGVVRAQYMRRPFASLYDDRPKYAEGLLAKIYRSFLGESRLFNRIDGAIGTFQLKQYGGYTKPLPPGTMARYERESVALTRKLLVQLRGAYRGIPAIMVNCDGNQSGPNRQWQALAKDAGFIPLAAPSDFLFSLTPDQRNDLINSDGSHLSEEGNQRYGAIVGDGIADLDLPVLRRR